MDPAKVANEYPLAMIGNMMVARCRQNGIAIKRQDPNAVILLDYIETKKAAWLKRNSQR